MRHRVVAGELDDASLRVSRPLTVRVNDLNRDRAPEPGEESRSPPAARGRAPGRGRGGRPRRRPTSTSVTAFSRAAAGAVLEQRQVGARHRAGSGDAPSRRRPRRCAQVDEADRPSPPAPVTRIATPSTARAVLSAASGRSTGTCPRASSSPKSSRAQWMSVRKHLGERPDLDAVERRRVGPLRREDAVDEDQPHPVDAARRSAPRPARAAPPPAPAARSGSVGSVKRQYSSRRAGAPRSREPARGARPRGAAPRPPRRAARARRRAAPRRRRASGPGPPSDGRPAPAPCPRRSGARRAPCRRDRSCAP